MFGIAALVNVIKLLVAAIVSHKEVVAIHSKTTFLLKEEVYSLTKVLRLRQPGVVFLEVVFERVNGMLQFVLVLPPKSAVDVVSREVQVQVGSALGQTLTFPGDTLETGTLEGNDNEIVTGSLVDIDDAGNRSEPRTFEFTLTDTIAPAQPGEVGIRVTAET